MDESNTMKKFVIILIGMFFGVIICWGTYEGITRTGDDKFCVICHEMTPMFLSYRNDVHGGAGDVGFKAECVDCHLPHNNIVNYVYTKARNGVVEGAIHFFGDVENIDWHKNRERKDEFVFDDGCIKCHQNFTNLPNLSHKGKQMHEHYTLLQGTNKQIGCAQCHIEVGHTGLRNTLNYFYPEYEIYDKKAKEQKESLLKATKIME